MNVHVIADAAGRLIWASTALPGATHDLSAARAHGNAAEELGHRATTS